MTAPFGTLYKDRGYSARSLEMLIRRELYFASPTQLNDPYDCRMNIRDSLSAAVARAHKLGNQAQSAELQRLQKFDAIYERMAQDLAGVGVFSLSRVPDSVLMWTHYSDDHSGFLRGLLSIGDFQHAPKPISDSRSNGCRVLSKQPLDRLLRGSRRGGKAS